MAGSRGDGMPLPRVSPLAGAGALCVGGPRHFNTLRQILPCPVCCARICAPTFNPRRLNPLNRHVPLRAVIAARASRLSACSICPTRGLLVRFLAPVGSLGS
jgi:hypothetical protein